MSRWGAEVFEADQDAQLTAFVQRQFASSTQVSYGSQVAQYKQFARLCGGRSGTVRVSVGEAHHVPGQKRVQAVFD